jgi:hypothetical protein
MWRVSLALILAGALGGFATGWRVHDWRDGAAATQAAKAVVVTVSRQAAVSQRIAVTAQAAQDRVRTVTRTLIQEVPTYVAPETDTRYALPWGFVRLHDAAAAGVDLPPAPEGPAEPDGAASDTTVSVAARVILSNYGACHADQARLAALQAWARGEGLAN